MTAAPKAGCVAVGCAAHNRSSEPECGPDCFACHMCKVCHDCHPNQIGA